MKKRKISIRAVLTFIGICLILAAAVFLYCYPNYRYLLKERLSRIGQEAKLKTLEAEEEQLFVLDLENLPEGSTVNQSLLLINNEYLLPDNLALEVSAYKDTDVYMNDCVKEAYAALARKVADDYNEKLYIRSAYRTQEEQQEQLDENSEVAAPIGASEHQAGLALDVYVPYFAGAGFLKSEAGQYVNSNGWEFGFIIRYPQGKRSITGQDFEPWHIRYVGKPHAEIMYKNNWTLEEYMEKLEVGKFYTYNGYLITRQSGTDLKIPQGCAEIVISPDNMGGYVITAKYE